MSSVEPKLAWRRPNVVAAWAITLTAVGLHAVFLLHAGGLWRDEVNVVNLATRSSLPEMTRDSFPLLMPMLVKVWHYVGLGSADLGLRSLGAIIGVGLLAGLWLSARLTTGAPPLLGLTLFALNSTVITYGDSLRAYGLGSLLVVLTAGTMWAYLNKPTGSRFATAALFAVLSAQAIYQNVLLVGAICFGAWLVSCRRNDWRTAWRVCLIAAATVGSLLPYLGSIRAVRDGAAVLRSGFSASAVFGNLKGAAGMPVGSYVYVWALLLVVVIAAGVAALLRGVESQRREEAQSVEPAPKRIATPFTSLQSDLSTAQTRVLRLFCGATLLAAVAGFGFFLWLAALPTQPWYFLPIMALAAVCLDAGLPALPRKLRVPAFGLVLATACISVPYAGQLLTCRLTNIDLLAQRVCAEAGPGDFVVVPQWYCGLTFDRYFKGPGEWTTLPPLADHRTHRYDLVRAQLAAPEPLKPVLEKIAATLRGGNRVWIVGRMYVPLRGSPGPQPIGVAPLPATGWSAAPFIRYWSAEVAHYLNEHSRDFSEVQCVDAGRVSPNENMQLFAATGWEKGR